jgi:aryl-alcohol dehydrogenase-like predicted oxidoreductase
VRAGKVRYIGFSDTPAWKVAQAQTLAALRGWMPLIALQIEYSLLERTVEGELVPAARELGLGITPWSPLRFGALSGKYTRANRGERLSNRGSWLASALHDKAYDVIDTVIAIAHELETSPARVAIAWVQSQPGVASTIIGVRTGVQLEDNLGAIEVKLTPAHVAALDAVSKPSLDFPAEFLRNVGPFGYGGTTIDGETFAANGGAPRDDSERY